MLLGRLSIIPCYPLGRESLLRIITLKLHKVVSRVKERYGADFTYTGAVSEEIIGRCNNIASGARFIDNIINNDLLPTVSTRFLILALEGRTFSAVRCDFKDGAFVCEFTDGEGQRVS